MINELQMLRIVDVARRLRISVKTARRLIDRGAIAVHRIGQQIRISEGDLANFLAAARSDPSSSKVEKLSADQSVNKNVGITSHN